MRFTFIYLYCYSYHQNANILFLITSFRSITFVIFTKPISALLPKIISYWAFTHTERIYAHRRTDNFLPGGGGGGSSKPFAQKISQVAQFFTKQSKRSEGHTMRQRRSYWHMKVARYLPSLSIN